VIAHGLGHFDKSRALQGDIACILLVMASIIVGYLAYLTMERPLNEAIRAFMKRTKDGTLQSEASVTPLVER
jgi:peptidoglycan/LPS O-acetylase OafA/YrhL